MVQSKEPSHMIQEPFYADDGQGRRKWNHFSDSPPAHCPQSLLWCSAPDQETCELSSDPTLGQIPGWCVHCCNAERRNSGHWMGLSTLNKNLPYFWTLSDTQIDILTKKIIYVQCKQLHIQKDTNISPLQCMPYRFCWNLITDRIFFSFVLYSYLFLLSRNTTLYISANTIC